VATALSFHVGQRGGNAIEHALEVHIDHALPILHLASLKKRVRHQARIIDDYVDASVRLHSAVHEMLDQVRYAPKATDNPFKATCRDGPQPDFAKSRVSCRMLATDLAWRCIWKGGKHDNLDQNRKNFSGLNR